MTCELVTFLSSQSAESWTAFWTAALFFATVILAGIALWQIIAARSENRKTQTLEACGRYDTDPVMFECQKRLVKVKGFRKRDDAALLNEGYGIRHEALTVLNFLDAIAIGLKQDLYIEKLAREHLINIVRKHVEEFVESGYLDKVDCPRESYASLIELDERWTKLRGIATGADI